MKKLAKMAVVLAMAVAMCFTLVGCGLSIDEIKGDWTVDTVNGQSLADYAASIGITEGQAVTNITIKDDKTMTSTNAVGSEEFDIELKSDGFEVKQKGKSDVFMSVKYDKDAQTLTYKIKDATGAEATYVLKKGTGNIEPMTAAPAADGTEDAAADSSDATTDDAATDDTAADETTDESADDSSDDASEDDAESVDDGSEEEAE